MLREAGATYLTYANAGVETRGPRIEGKSVILRAEVSEAQTVEFSYAPGDDAAFQRFGPVTPLARFSWWKGSRPAVFTYVKANVDEERAPPHPIAHNYVDVDWFRVAVSPR